MFLFPHKLPPTCSFVLIIPTLILRGNPSGGADWKFARQIWRRIVPKHSKSASYNLFWLFVGHFFQNQWQPKMASWEGWAGPAAPRAAIARVSDPSLKAWSDFDFKSTCVLSSYRRWIQEEGFESRLFTSIWTYGPTRQEGPDRKGWIPRRDYPWNEPRQGAGSGSGWLCWGADIPQGRGGPRFLG